MDHSALIQQLPGMCYWVDSQSRFIAANQNTAHWTGFSCSDELAGKRYHDMRCKAVEAADVFRQQDQWVLDNRQSLKILAYYCYANTEWKLLIGEKQPMWDAKQQLAGVSCQFMTIQEPALRRKLIGLLNMDKAERLSNQTGNVYYVQSQHSPMQLTRRESECLYYLLRGYTAKGIGLALGLSFKTVESHIAHLKTKFDCYTKSALIEAAIEQGYAQVIPESLLAHYSN